MSESAYSNTRHKQIYDSKEDKELDTLRNKIAVFEKEEKDVGGDLVMNEVDGDLDLQGENTTDDADLRSIYVGNVDYSGTSEDIRTHFFECGTILRVTIPTNSWTGHPKGFAYVEFARREDVSKALELNSSYFKGRELKVLEKRTNIPGYGRYARRAYGHQGYLQRPYGRSRRRPRGRFMHY